MLLPTIVFLARGGLTLSERGACVLSWDIYVNQFGYEFHQWDMHESGPRDILGVHAPHLALLPRIAPRPALLPRTSLPPYSPSRLSPRAACLHPKSTPSRTSSLRVPPYTNIVYHPVYHPVNVIPARPMK